MPQRARRPRGHIRELPSGSFQAIAYTGTDPLTGKLRYVRETTATYQAAEVALTRLQNQVDEDRHPKSDLTVRQAIERWLEVAQLEDTTRDRYEDLIRIYIDPTLGAMKASKLDAQMLERWYARLQRCRSCDGRRVSGHVCRPLSSSTVRRIHFIVSGALGRAVRWDQIPVNRAELAEAPSPAATEPDPPTAAEAARLLGEAWDADPDWGLLLWLTMVTGSRRGEISALRWHHVDLDGALLTLQRSNAQPKSGLKEKTTKTRQQRRVTIDPQTVALLTAHRQSCEQRCDRARRRTGPGRVLVLAGAGRLGPLAAAFPDAEVRPPGPRPPRCTPASSCTRACCWASARWRRRIPGWWSSRRPPARPRTGRSPL